MADGFDDDMTRCPCCDGEGYFYHGDEPKSPWGDAATIARLTKERDEAHERFVFWRNEADKRTAALAQARAEAAAAYERAATVQVGGYDMVSPVTRATIRALATEPGTTALAEMLDAETRACAETIRPRLGPQGNGVIVAELHRQAVAILARIDQRKEAGKCKE